MLRPVRPDDHSELHFPIHLAGGAASTGTSSKGPFTVVGAFVKITGTSGSLASRPRAAALSLACAA